MSEMFYSVKHLLPTFSFHTGSDNDLHVDKSLVKGRKNTFETLQRLQGLLKTPTQLLKHADMGSLTSQYCFNLPVSFYNTASYEHKFLGSPNLYTLL